MVTHDIHAARLFADHFVMLHEGKVLMGGTFEELKRSHDEFVGRFLQQAA